MGYLILVILVINQLNAQILVL